MIDIRFWEFALPALARGTALTLFIALGASIIGFTLGTLLAFAHTSSTRWLSFPVTCYITIMRGTPMIIQIPFFVYYFLPLIGIKIPLLAAAIIAIGLNSAAYISQTIRSGIGSISKGQTEAASTLGLTRWQTMRFIILPQALTVIIPALISEFVTLIKDSSLASTVGVLELFKEGQIIISRTYDALPIYAAIAIIYLGITGLLSFIGNKIEKKMRQHVTH